MTIDFRSDFTMTIGGKAVDGEKRLRVVNPASEAIIATIPDASQEQLDAAVMVARNAFPGWASQPVEYRQSLLRSLGERLMAHAEEFASLLTLEQGKPKEMAVKEVVRSALWLTDFASMELPVETIENIPGQRVEIRRIPLGVVGGIVPWNFPMLLAVWKIAPALLAGNSLVIKPSPFTPLTLLKLGELVRDLLPPGVFNVVCGGDALGPWMSAHLGIDKISFTGSTATGRKVMESGALNLKRLTLELGGNDAAIVMPDVDVKSVAEPLFWSAFNNSGQVCIATKRLYIHEDIYEELSAALVSYARTLRMGDGSQDRVDLGPVQNQLLYQRLCDMLDDAKENKLRFLFGGNIDEHRKGYFVPITLVDNPPDQSRVVAEEAFGPILPLLKFKDVDEVISRANDSEYGLAGSVWSKDVEHARAIAARLQTGTVWINQAQALFPNVPFAGQKQSGIGVENGIDGLHEYTQLQTIAIRQPN